MEKISSRLPTTTTRSYETKQYSRSNESCRISDILYEATGIMLKYPSNWEISDETEINTFFTNPLLKGRELQRFIVKVLDIREEFQAHGRISLPDFVNWVALNIFYNANIIQQNQTTTTIAGFETRQVVLDYTYDGAPFRALLVISIVGNQGYIFGYLSAPGHFTDGLSISRRMLDSAR